MPRSLTYLFKRSFEFVPIGRLEEIPTRVRGVYVLYRAGKGGVRNVVYVGMARGQQSGARGRLLSHRRSKEKLWTHCSVYEVWDNIPASLVEELEGLFRHIYRKDLRTNQLNRQKAYRPLLKLARQSEPSGC